MEPDPLNLDIPKKFNLQGAKLATLSQALAYKGIKEKHKPADWDATKLNLNLTRAALREYSGENETNETIWCSLHNLAIQIRPR